MATIAVEAQNLIDRLAAVDPASPTIDIARAEAAIRRHFELLGVEPLPVRWVDDAESGIHVVRSAAESAAWSAAESAAWSAAESAAWSAARSAAWSAAWSAARSAARSAAESAARSSASRSTDLAALDRWIAIWLPFVDAYEAGLWLFWVTAKEVVAVPHPSMQIVDERLHSDVGPAVSWPGGARYWFWRGVQVPQKVIEAPSTLTQNEIKLERNVEVRRVMLERFGFDRFISEGGGELVHEDDFGRLLRFEFVDDEPLVVLEVINSTPEPDGSFKNYWLRVPPSMETARAAAAWTFDVSPRDYRLAIET